MHLRSLLVFLLIIGCYPCCFSQFEKIQFEHITPANGLPNVTVGSILQDHEGFMWFGTIDGLSRYDGFDMVTFRNNPNDSTSLSNNEIWALCKDSSRYIWVGTRGGGLNRFDPKTEQFKSYRYNREDSTTISNDIIRSMLVDSKGRLWLGTYNGLCRYDYEQDIFYRYTQDGIERGGNTIHDIVEDQEGRLWLGTMGGGVQIFSPEKETFGSLNDVLGFTVTTINPSVISICMDRFGDIWLGTTNGVERIRFTDGKIPVLISYTYQEKDEKGITAGAVYKILEDQQGRLWFGTDNGFNRYDWMSDTFSNHTHHDLHEKSLSDNQVWLIYEDRDGNLWLGTQWGGVNLYKPGRDVIQQYSYNSYNETGLSNRVVQAVEQDADGIIWLGIDHGGLNRFNRDRNEFVHYRHDPNNPQSISADPVLTVRDYGEYLLIGTWGGGFGKFDKSTAQFQRILVDPDNPNSICNETVHGLLQDSKGNIWVGTYNCGAYLINSKTGETEHFAPNSSDPNSLSSGRVWTIFEASNSDIWLGTNNGLNRFKSETRTFDVFRNIEDDPASISNNAIRVIYEDRNERMWFGTSRGLNLYDPTSDTFSVYTARDGLPGNVISSIVEDSKGNLWLGTFTGISRFSPSTGEVFTVSVQNGLTSNQVRYRSGCQLNTGELLFGSPRGFVIFHPDSLRPISNTPSLVITDLLINNHRISPGVDYNGINILQHSINHTEFIRLPYRFNDLAFRVASIDYQSPTINQHAYRLEGDDTDWIQLGNRRWINFNNLKPGEYTLQVKGTNSNREWSDQIKTIQFIIDPPFWKTWYALLFYLVFGLSFLTFLLVTIINKERLTKRLEMKELVTQQEQQLNDIRLRFYTNVTHEFRTPLSLIIAPLCDLINKTHELDLPDEYLRKLKIVNNNAQRLLGLVNQLIDFRKTESGLMKLKVTQCYLSDLISEISHSFAELAKLSHIDFHVIDELKEKVIWCESGKIEMVINNLISNALRFAQTNGFVRVRLRDDADYVEITVEDNGPGIPEKEIEKIFERFYQAENDVSVATSGIGLALSKKLIELHKGEIGVTSDPGKLTRFTVRLRKGKDHFQDHELIAIPDFDQTKSAETNKTRKPTHGLKSNIHKKQDQLILIVDDNKELRNYISSLLSKFYNVELAQDGIEALEKIDSVIPDMVITDVLMPNMDGFELCQKIKNNDKTRHIPVILVTAKTQDRFRFLGLQQGADDFISKPFDPDYLVEKVHQTLKTRLDLEDKYSKKVVLGPQEVLITPADEILIEKAKKIVEANMGDPEFETHKLASAMGMSYSTLYRRFSPLIEATPAEFIRDMRLIRSAQLLKDKSKSITEVVLESGFQDLKTFRSWFEKKYQCSPSEYRKSISSD